MIFFLNFICGSGNNVDDLNLRLHCFAVTMTYKSLTFIWFAWNHMQCTLTFLIACYLCNSRFMAFSWRCSRQNGSSKWIIRLVQLENQLSKMHWYYWFSYVDVVFVLPINTCYFSTHHNTLKCRTATRVEFMHMCVFFYNEFPG